MSDKKKKKRKWEDDPFADEDEPRADPFSEEYYGGEQEYRGYD